MGKSRLTFCRRRKIIASNNSMPLELLDLSEDVLLRIIEHVSTLADNLRCPDDAGQWRPAEPHRTYEDSVIQSLSCLEALSMTCTRLRRIAAPSLFRKLQFSSQYSTRLDTEDIVRAGRASQYMFDAVRSLDLTPHRRARQVASVKLHVALQRALMEMPHLTSLKLKLCGQDVPHFVATAAKTGFRQMTIETLEIPIHSRAILPSFLALTALVYKNYPDSIYRYPLSMDLRFEGFSALINAIEVAGNISKLTEFHLCDHQYDHHEKRVATVIPDHLPSLSRLSLAAAVLVRDELPIMLSQMQNLKELRLRALENYLAPQLRWELYNGCDLNMARVSATSWIAEIAARAKSLTKIIFTSEEYSSTPIGRYSHVEIKRDDGGAVSLCRWHRITVGWRSLIYAVATGVIAAWSMC